MTTDWSPSRDEVAAMREARRNGSMRSLLRQQIAEGRARLDTTTVRTWPASGGRSDIGGTTCPHCGAGPDQKCHLRSRDKTLPAPHQQRISKWAQTVACCPTCQAAPGVRCHKEGAPLAPGTIHAARYQEAEATAA